MGQIFEQVCKQFLDSASSYKRTGRWWYREDEIDIVALNESENRILFGECKWSRNKVGIKVLDSLKEKSKKVRWENEKRRVEYALFSRAGFTSDLEEGGYDNLKLYTLDDIRKGFSVQSRTR